MELGDTPLAMECAGQAEQSRAAQGSQGSQGKEYIASEPQMGSQLRADVVNAFNLRDDADAAEEVCLCECARVNANG